MQMTKCDVITFAQVLVLVLKSWSLSLRVKSLSWS